MRVFFFTAPPYARQRWARSDYWPIAYKSDWTLPRLVQRHVLSAWASVRTRRRTCQKRQRWRTACPMHHDHVLADNHPNHNHNCIVLWDIHTHTYLYSYVYIFSVGGLSLTYKRPHQRLSTYIQTRMRASNILLASLARYTYRRAWGAKHTYMFEAQTCMPTRLHLS